MTRLTLAACLAYLLVIYLGIVAQQDGWQAIIHRWAALLSFLVLHLLTGDNSSGV